MTASDITLCYPEIGLEKDDEAIDNLSGKRYKRLRKRERWSLPTRIRTTIKKNAPALMPEIDRVIEKHGGWPIKEEGLK